MKGNLPETLRLTPLQAWWVPGLALIVATLLISVFSSPHPSAAGGNRLTLRTDTLTVHYDPGLENAAGRLASNFPRIRSEVETRVGWKLKLKPVVILAGDPEEFRKMGGGPVAAGLSLFPSGRIVLNFSAPVPQFVLLNGTLRHEIAHLLLHENVRAHNLPRWFDEGVAEWASQTAPPDFSSRIENFSTSYAITVRGFTLAQLRDKFPESGAGMVLAYEESRLFVEHLESKYGADAFRGILSRTAAGDDIATAFRKATGSSIDSIEAEWRLSLRQQVRWVLMTEGGLRRLGAFVLSIPRIFSEHKAKIIFAGAGILLLAFLRSTLRGTKPGRPNG